jgi:hypothetical protein
VEIRAERLAPSMSISDRASWKISGSVLVQVLSSSSAVGSGQANVPKNYPEQKFPKYVKSGDL